jgi:hypothetical protein
MAMASPTNTKNKATTTAWVDGRGGTALLLPVPTPGPTEDDAMQKEHSRPLPLR